MKKSRDYEIPHLSLQTGLHQFTYQLEKEFFEGFGNEELANSSFKVSVDLLKNPKHLELTFHIEGILDCICDRCGDDLRLPIWDEFSLIVKWIEADKLQDYDEDEDTDMVYISKSEHIIDIANWLYEYVVLSIPIQKVHPTLPDGSDGCNAVALALLNAHQPKVELEDISNNSLAEQLNKLKKKKDAKS